MEGGDTSTIALLKKKNKALRGSEAVRNASTDSEVEMSAAGSASASRPLLHDDHHSNGSGTHLNGTKQQPNGVLAGVEFEPAPAGGSAGGIAVKTSVNVASEGPSPGKSTAAAALRIGSALPSSKESGGHGTGRQASASEEDVLVHVHDDQHTMPVPKRSSLALAWLLVGTAAILAVAALALQILSVAMPADV